MSFIPYLHFNGGCADAMRFYCDLFGGTDLQIMPYSDAPPGSLPPETPKSDAVMHSQFAFGQGLLMAADNPPGMGGMPQASVSITVLPDNAGEAKRIFDGLAVDGGVIQQLAPTFFSPAFGMVKDRFGTHWMVMVPGEMPA